MRTSSLFARRLTASAALVALPLAAAVGCGKAAETKKASVEDTFQKASDNLSSSGSTSVTLRFDDKSGKAKTAFTTGDDALSGDEADLLLGGTFAMTIDPAAGKTLRDLQNTPQTAPIADQLKLVNISMAVSADGGSLAEFRIVGGDLYAKVGLDKIAGIAEKSDPSSDVSGQIDEFAASAPPEYAPLVNDVKAGKWLKLPLAPFASQLQQAVPTPSPSVDSQALGRDLLAAVRPFVTVTDAGGSGSERVLDVKVQAKQALKAAMGSLQKLTAGLPGAETLDTTALDKIGDGTVDGQVFVDDDHLKKITMDLGTAVRLAPPGATPAPDLTGSLITVEVDDSADEVTVPSDVSGVDLGALVQQALAGFGGALNS